ncbi:MAG: hypothetical protein RMY16_08465 [Nostoc sp. DedQUE12b]|uniref:hypothetical protein n=1 Tax=Nostoc sp. DedQUE12b TaxID=3075398 RepID=UPI002AD31E4C|nr:hypothetical protein [Nostoc sp. DedQUE12b]MDZ8085615.1 hypothetical protein [Nostoc sp. DedQUE12b]
MLKQIKDIGIEKTIPDNTDMILFQQADGITGHITRENFLSGISSGSSVEYAQIADVKPSGTGGGTYTSANTTIIRTLNTVISSASWLSLSSNIFTLQPGTYFIDAIVPAILVNNFRGWIEDSSGTIVLLGSSAYNAPGSAYAATNSYIKGKITVTSETSYTVKFKGVSASSFVYTLGVQTGFAGQSEVYTQVNITKVA